MGARAHRLTSVVLAFALSGAPAVLSGCLALCLASPAVATPANDAPAAHHGHVAVSAPAAASAHAHHGATASPRPATIGAHPSPQASSEARLIGTCDRCCVSAPVAFVAGPGVERTSGQALGVAPTVAVVSIHPIVTMPAAAPPSAPVPPPSPGRAPLPLRI